MDKYEVLTQIGDGTFGSVAKAVNKKTGQLVAIKKMKRKFYTWEECVKLPEVDVVRRIHGHPNVVKLREVIRENNELFFVFEYMDGDLLGVIQKAKQKGESSATVSAAPPLIPYPLVRSYMCQILQALMYIHKRGYFHRDMKPENLLVRKDANGDEVLKLADFGLVKEIRARPPFTDYVSTRWYRAPELLLQDRFYGAAVDIWAAGCIMAELITMRPLFPGTNEVDQLFKIMSVLGSPTEELWPGGLRLAKKIRYTFPVITGTGLAHVLPSHIPESVVDLLRKMLAYDPRVRLTAEQCLQHSFFNVGIDEGNAPSAAAIDQLAFMANRMLSASKTAPPALKSSTTKPLAALKGAKTTIDASLSGASPRKMYVLGTTKDPVSSLPKLPLGLSTTPPPLDALQNASSSLCGRGLLLPEGLPAFGNGQQRSSLSTTAVMNGKRRSQETEETSLSKKLASLKNVQTGKGGLSVPHALATGSAVHSPSAAPSFSVTPPKAKPSTLLPIVGNHDVNAPPRRRNPLKETETTSPTATSSAAKRGVDLDELMEEFASEMTAIGVLAQRHDGDAPGGVNSESCASHSTLSHYPVAALLSSGRYKSTTTNTDSSFKVSNSPRTTHPANIRKVDSVSAQNDLPRMGQPTSKVGSPSLKALLAKHKASSLAYQ
ncbi:hypothetical protein JKF63_03176 [Porcisia hertigi]|uniref:Protein kinase domain-containing protein n=1 Tax=Porcisia hertigi TaxID=2761500 RepID=A0A836L7K7_9TRYP|nr:hypothetical protein JKF63_03176 [Porcisia hertigi]